MDTSGKSEYQHFLIAHEQCSWSLHRCSVVNSRRLQLPRTREYIGVKVKQKRAQTQSGSWKVKKKNCCRKSIKFPLQTVAFHVNNSLSSLSLCVPYLLPTSPVSQRSVPRGKQEADSCTPPSLHPAYIPAT